MADILEAPLPDIILISRAVPSEECRAGLFLAMASRNASISAVRMEVSGQRGQRLNVVPNTGPCRPPAITRTSAVNCRPVP